MKKLLQNKYVNLVLGAAIVFLVGKILWNLFDVGTRIDIHTAVRDILEERNAGRARDSLDAVNDRGRVLTALKEALQDEDATIAGKIAVLRTFSRLKEQRPVVRALDSKLLSTRRAAAFYWHRDQERKSEVGPVALEWIADESADSRHYAAIICKSYNLEAAVPALMAVLDKPARTQREIQLVQSSLNALVSFNPEGFGAKVMALARDGDLASRVRETAFSIVGRLKDLPTDEVQEFMIATLLDRGAENGLRHGAAQVLGHKEYANETAWKALTDLLMDENEEDRQNRGGVVQRSCLFALGVTLPLDRLEDVLLDRRVYTHPYFGIRIDVATGLATLHVEKRVALDVMCGYLVDEDPQDTLRMVRQEAWLTLWTLSGIAYGVKEQELFRHPPKKLTGEQLIREYVFRPAQIRPGVSPAQVDAVKAVTRSLADMQRIRETYQKQIGMIVNLWKQQAEAAEEAERKKKEAEESKGKDPQPKDDTEPDKDGVKEPVKKDDTGCGGGDDGKKDG